MKKVSEWIISIDSSELRQKILNNINNFKDLDLIAERLEWVINSFDWRNTKEWVKYWSEIYNLACEWKIVMKDSKEDEIKSFAVECPNDYATNEKWQKYVIYLQSLWMKLGWTWPWSFYWVTIEWITDWKTQKNQFWKIYNLDSEFITQLIWEKNIVQKITEESDTITFKRRRPYKLKLNPSF